jgi:hypothetical protein
MVRALCLVVACGCGFQSAGSGSDAAVLDGGGTDGMLDTTGPPADLAAPLTPDGACAWLANADLASKCTDPGTGTCLDLISCVTACTGDATCTNNCWTTARTAQSKSLAMGYIDCRTNAVASGGACFAQCQVATTQGQAECIACLHVCSYDPSCTYGCSCGVCSGQLSACYADR